MEQFDLLTDLPMGFGMALAQNVVAMEAFASLSPAEQRRIVEQTHAITSKREMQAFVQSHFSLPNRPIL